MMVRRGVIVTTLHQDRVTTLGVTPYNPPYPDAIAALLWWCCGDLILDSSDLVVLWMW